MALENAYFSKAKFSSCEFSFNMILPLTREVAFLKPNKQWMQSSKVVIEVDNVEKIMSQNDYVPA